MHDFSFTLLGRVQQLVKPKQQSTNAGQNVYSPFKLPASQVRIFRSALLKRKGEGQEGGEKTDKIHPQN